MNARERFNAVMRFEPVDRLPLMEFMFYWPETLDRWTHEGMPADADPVAYFGYDRFEWLPVDFNLVPPFPAEVLADEDDTRVVRDVTGVVKREYKHGSAMPHYIEFPMKNRSDFLALRERLDPTSSERYPADWPQKVEELRHREHPVGLVARGLLAFFRDFMEFNAMSIAFLTEPDWVREVMAFHTDFLIALWERALTDVEVDMVQLGEDMAFKNGPMVSPGFVREFMVPEYRRLTDFLRAHGVEARIIDSDGDIGLLVPLFLQGGFTGVLPLENNAGSSPLLYRGRFPRLQMIGGIDKQKIAQGGPTLEAEVREKVGTLGPLGGYIPSFDHSVHPDVSLETYRRYLVELRRHSAADVRRSR